MSLELLLALVLGAVALGELVMFSYYVKETNREKSKLVNALISKDSKDMFNLEMTDKIKVEKKEEVSEPDNEIAIEDIPDDEYLKIITQAERTGNGSN